MNKYLLLLITLAVTLAGIFSTMIIQDKMNDTIVENNLQVKDFIEDGGAPPEIAISTIFLGGFRNIVINFLWLRMTDLQSNGKYYEMVQLADWILSVQPDNAQVAQFLGWNMAYNISVVHPDRDVRWRWIRHGTQTMSRAIALNPDELDLYRELGWIYLHKIGDELDDHHLYFKYLLAKELYTIYGNELAPDWEALAKAPATRREFLKKFPEEAAVWRYADGEYDDVLKNYIASGTLPEGVTKNLSEEDLAIFRNGMARIALKQQFNLDPEIIMEVNRTYGELCWLLPESIAIYWGHQGVKAARGEDELVCRRIIAQGLKVTFSMGNIFFISGEPEPEYIRLPNTKVFDAATANYMDIYAELHGDEAGDPNVPYSIFLQECLITYFLYNDKEGEDKCFALLQKEEFDNAQYMTKEQFLNKRIQDLIKKGSYNQIQSMLVTLVLRSLYAYANGDRETAEYQLNLAKRIDKVYAHRNKDIAYKDRLKQVSLEQIKNNLVAYIRERRPELAMWLEAEFRVQDTDREKSGNELEN